MRNLWILPALVLVGCQASGPSAATSNQPAGTYAGSGKFNGGARSMKVEGKLTLSPDGTYALAMKPSLLAMESGTYTTDGRTLQLQPAPPETKTDAQGRPTLASALQRSVQPKTMRFEEGFRSVNWNDGPMSVEMARQP